MRLSHGAFYRVVKGKWTRIGSTYAEALLAYAKLEAQATVRRDFDALLTAFLAEREGKVATTTLKNYRIWSTTLRRVFGHMEPGQIRVEHGRRFLDESPKYSTARHQVALLSAALSWGAERGWVERNVLLGWNKGPREKRTRYITDAEWQAILHHARPDVRLALEFLFLTGLRVRDALALRWSDVKDDGLHVRVAKTKDAVVFERTAALEAMLARLRRGRVTSLHLLTGRGQPLGYDNLLRLYQAAAKAAGVAGVTLHDIRRKRITDLTDAEGSEAARRLAVHADQRTTAGYYAQAKRVRV
jgi:integrase